MTLKVETDSPPITGSLVSLTPWSAVSEPESKVQIGFIADAAETKDRAATVMENFMVVETVEEEGGGRLY